MKKKLLMTLIVATLFGCNDSNDSSVTDLNRAPVANPDIVTVMQGEAVSINVLDNDTDPDGDTLILKEVNGLLLEGNTAQYQSASDDLVGDKTFSYTITDGKLDAASSITISVTAKPVLEPALSRGEYAGSEACSTCHASVYEEWKDTKHATVMRKLYTEDHNTIDAPWGTEAEPKEFIVNSHKYTSFMKGEEYWLTVHDPIDSTKDRTYRIDVVGYKTQTNFFNYDAEAKSLILMPLIYWNDEPEGEEYWSNWLEWLWYDKAGNLFPKEDLDQHIKFASYENRCAECHLTGFEIESFKDNGFAGNVVDDSNIWEAEFATGCENCHGPAAKHTRTMDKTDVVNPDDLTGANYGSECSHCHQAGHPVTNDSGFVEMPYIYNEEDPLKKGQHFNVGDNLADFYVFTQRDLWPGTEYEKQSKSHQMDLEKSKHGESGMKCSSCHNPHSQGMKLEGDAQCISCHADKSAAEHKMNIHQLVGAACTDCHMPWSKRSRDRSRRYDVRSHHFEVISPTESLGQYDYLYPFTQDGADPEHKMTKSWAAVQEIGICYDSWKYPPNTKECTDFDVMPNACSSCHDKEFPVPGKFDDIERNKLIEGESRFQRFIDATSK